MARRVAAAVVIGLVLSAVVAGPAAQSLPPAPVPDYRFPAGTALLLFYVAPDRTADFEAIVGRIAHALETSPDPVRRQQAANWRLFRSAEPARDAVVYVFLLDPAIAGADYDPVRMLSESLPAEVQPLYQKLKAGVIRVERMALTRLR